MGKNCIFLLGPSPNVLRHYSIVMSVLILFLLMWFMYEG